MAADEPGTDSDPGEADGAASDPFGGNDAAPGPHEDSPATESGEDDGDPNRRSIPGRFARAAAWVVGPVLVAVGAFGLNAGTGTAWLYLVVGLFVTPRTRRELGELCRILCGAD